MAFPSTPSIHKKRFTNDASSSTPSIPRKFMYDVFVSFRGEDTCTNFVDHLYHALQQKGIRTYKDDERITKGKQIYDELIGSIEDSKLYIVVFSKNYASSSWCLDELLKIMECHKTANHMAYPVFYDVEPSEVRNQSGVVGKPEWREAMKEAAALAGWELKNTADGVLFYMVESTVEKSHGDYLEGIQEGTVLQALKSKKELFFKLSSPLLIDGGLKTFSIDEATGKRSYMLSARDLYIAWSDNPLFWCWKPILQSRHEAKFIQIIVDELSLELRGINFTIDEKLVGMKSRVNDVLTSLGTTYDNVRIFGIKGMGGRGKTTLARAVFDQISFHFEGKSFVENVREVSKASLLGLKSVQNQILSDVFNDKGMTVSSVHEGICMMKKMMPRKRVIIILDDVDHREQLKALAGDMTWFKPGSIIIITTRDRQVLEFYEEKLIHDVRLLSHEDAMCLFRRYAFGKVIPNTRYKELSRQFVQYAAGLPLAIEVLGSFLCGKDELEWMDALLKLKKIPSHEILEILEISYRGLEEEYKEIFLNVACFLKGLWKTTAIKVLESCGFYARNGLRVLEEKSLITVNHYGILGMHNHIEEMGMNIVRRSHPDNPNKHSRLWIDEEIKEIFANDLGTEVTRYIKFNIGELSPEVAMKGLGKMKELRSLYVYQSFSGASEKDFSHQNWNFTELPNTLRYLYWLGYPFRSLPTTFQPDNLVSLKMTCSTIIQLWEGGERKVLNKLRFLNLSYSKLRTLDLGVAPNLEKLNLGKCRDLIELCLTRRCLNLRSVKLNDSKLRTLDIELSPNLKHLNLRNCHDLEEFHMAAGCLKKLVYLNLSGCLRFRSFEIQSSRNESLNPLAKLHLFAESLDECHFHPENNLPKFQFACYHKEYQPLLTGNPEKLISIGMCASKNIDTFSRSICGLQHLKKLKLEGSILEAPKDLDQLECLRQLDFSNTKIKHLPDNICVLKHLKSIKLRKCLLLEKLPEDLGRLERLKKLNLSNTAVKELPDGICMLKRLKSINLNGCSLLQKLPENLGQLECLKKLYLSYTRIKDLPDSICMLEHLESLHLYNCSLLEKLPKDIGRLECLEDLDLSFCEFLQEVPESICNMKGLEYLNLSGCIRIEKLPEELGRLVSLKELDLKDTCISHIPRSIFSLKGVRIFGPRRLLQSCGSYL